MGKVQKEGGVKIVVNVAAGDIVEVAVLVEAERVEGVVLVAMTSLYAALE